MKIYRFLLVIIFAYLIVQIFYFNYLLHQLVLKLFFAIALGACIWGIVSSRKKDLELFNQFVIAVILLIIDLSLRVFFYYESKIFGFDDQNIAIFGLVMFFIITE